MTQLLTQFASDVSEGVRETIIDNPDKVYFPNFGSGDNILKKRIFP